MPCTSVDIWRPTRTMKPDPKTLGLPFTVTRQSPGLVYADSQTTSPPYNTPEQGGSVKALLLTLSMEQTKECEKKYHGRK